MRRILAAIVFLLGIGSPVADAGELSLLLNGKAIHLGLPSGVIFNEENWGGGLQYDWDRAGRKWAPFLSISGFLDSYKHPSYYAGGGYMRRWMLGNTWHADAGWIAFLMTRQDENGGRPFPGVLPAFSIGTDRASLNVTYIPRVRPKMVEMIFLQLKLRLSK